MIFRVELAHTAVLPDNGANTAAAETVTGTVGNGHSVLHNKLTLIRIFHFNEQLVQPFVDVAVKLHLPPGFRKFADGAQGVFQTVGQQGAQLRV